MEPRVRLPCDLLHRHTGLDFQEKGWREVLWADTLLSLRLPKGKAFYFSFHFHLGKPSLVCISSHDVAPEASTESLLCPRVALWVLSSHFVPPASPSYRKSPLGFSEVSSFQKAAEVLRTSCGPALEAPCLVLQLRCPAAGRGAPEGRAIAHLPCPCS